MTKTDLEQIRYLNRELKMWERELAELRSSSLVPSPKPGVSRRVGAPDPVGKRGNAEADLEKKISEMRDELKRRHDEAVELVLTIPDSLTRQIIYNRCVKLMSWRRVAYEVGGNNTKDSVRMVYNRFMSKL